jgi:hypothetical protein
MAMVLSQVEGRLVVRERRAILPNLTQQGGVALENVMVVAQLEGESHEDFCSRVLDRARWEFKRGHPLSELVVLAPANGRAEDRAGFFDLVEATTRAAPMLNVRLAFALEQRHDCPLRVGLRRARNQVQAQPCQPNRNGGYE